MINAVIDLYHGDTVSSFADVQASGVLGVIHKATQGTTFQDPQYHSRRTQGLAVGLLWGAYHFGAGGDGAAQADYFLSFVAPGPNDLLVLDFEEVSGGGASMTLAEAEQFVSRVQAVTGRWPGLYGGSYLKDRLGSAKSPALASCWLWIAQYASQPSIPANWATWTMWQYTDGSNGPQPHSVSGVKHGCDRDQFNGTPDELRKLWGGTA